MHSLNYFVAQYKLYHGEIGTEHDQQYLQWTVDCLKQLRAWKMMDNAAKWTHLDIQCTNGQKWAFLPKDYRRYLWVGRCCEPCAENGYTQRFVSFDLNNDLCMIPPWEMCSCDGEQTMNTMQSACNNQCGSGQWNVGAYWGWGSGEPYSFSYSIGSYAIGPGVNNCLGTFQIDDRNQIIRFDSMVDKAIMKYEGDFLTGMGNCFVPPGIEDNLIIPKFMEWFRKKFSSDAIMRREATEAYRDFYGGVRDYNSQRNALNKDEWYALIRRNEYMGVKA